MTSGATVQRPGSVTVDRRLRCYGCKVALRCLIAIESVGAMSQGSAVIGKSRQQTATSVHPSRIHARIIYGHVSSPVAYSCTDYITAIHGTGNHQTLQLLPEYPPAPSGASAHTPRRGYRPCHHAQVRCSTAHNAARPLRTLLPTER